MKKASINLATLLIIFTYPVVAKAGGLAGNSYSPSKSSIRTELAVPISQINQLTGRWSGSYICGQGITNLRLDISARSASQIDAVFRFSAHPSNPGVPSGSLKMRGTYQAFNQRTIPNSLKLNATTWIQQPPGYVTVNLTGIVLLSQEKRIIGQVIGPSCSLFDVIKN